MKSHIIASIFTILVAHLPHAVDSLASVFPVVDCRRINNPTDNCTFLRAEELLTWFDHNLKATQMGCTLASIINSEEQAQVEALFDNKIDPSRTRIWMGAMKVEDEWQWSDGSVFHYTNWHHMEPSNETTETHAHLMFPNYPNNKMKWNNRSPNETQAAVYKCCYDEATAGFAPHSTNNHTSSSNSSSSKRSFEVCAMSYQYTPSPILLYNETTGEPYPAYGGGYGFDYTIYKSSAKGLDVFNDANLIPPDANTNIKVYVDRNDNNTCTVHVKTAQMPESTPGGDAVDNGVVCNSCTWCGEDHWSQYSADCTNIEHGRKVECEAADIVYFPLSEEAL